MRVNSILMPIVFLMLLTTAMLFPNQSWAQPAVKSIYRSDDGGVLYLRAVGDVVYGFGEHPGKKYAYVLSGKQTGDRIAATFWDIPKGTRTETGDLELQVSQAGARLVRKSGSANIGIGTWDEIAAGAFPWPAKQAAGFQKTSTNDLDGVFADEDASRHYMREMKDGNVVWVAEPAAQPGERPAWASVFVGKRTKAGAYSGTFADVPKGLATAKGNFGASLIANRRELALQQTGADRGQKLAPDYAVDWDAFASAISNAFDGKVVGYAYAIGRDGALIRTGAGGSRRLAQDSGQAPFTKDTKAQAASTSKTITAVALVKALHDRNLTVDTNVAPFLPDCLKQGPGINTLKFRELLDHTSGLSEPRCRDDPYACLEKIIADGRTGPQVDNYNNTAYALMRFLVPLVASPTQAKGQFKLFKCENPHDELNKDISTMFARYMFDKILTPTGATASFFPSGDFALNYNHQDRSVKGHGPKEDFSRRAGAGYLAISAVDYVLFIGALNRGALLPKSVVKSMYDGDLGFRFPITGAAGKYFTKNGTCPTSDDGVGCGAQVMVYPSGIQAYVILNSDSNSYSGSLPGILAAAFDKALR
jgi:CubicO group peptidase (beta-lactamase class C family)